MVMIAALAAALALWCFVGSPVTVASRLDVVARAERSRGSPGIPRDHRLALGLALGAALAWLVSGVLGWIAWPLGVATGFACAWLLGRMEPAAAARERQRVAVDLPGALDLLRAVLDAGLPMQTAVAAVTDAVGGPLGERLQTVQAHVRLGGTEPDAWRLLAADPVLGTFARDVARTVDSGAGLTELLLHQAEDARELLASVVEQRARAVGVRTVLPLMCCYLPAFLVIGIAPIVAGFVTGLWR